MKEGYTLGFPKRLWRKQGFWRAVGTWDWTRLQSQAEACSGVLPPNNTASDSNDNNGHWWPRFTTKTSRNQSINCLNNSLWSVELVRSEGLDEKPSSWSIHQPSWCPVNTHSCLLVTSLKSLRNVLSYQCLDVKRLFYYMSCCYMRNTFVGKVWAGRVLPFLSQLLLPGVLGLSRYPRCCKKDLVPTCTRPGPTETKLRGHLAQEKGVDLNLPTLASSPCLAIPGDSSYLLRCVLKVVWIASLLRS